MLGRATEEPTAPGEAPRPDRRSPGGASASPPESPDGSAADKYLPVPPGERQGIGLCLSGGGFRAALFHLGALRRLDELQILCRIWTISSISGGSIVAAHLADRLRWPIAGRTTDWEGSIAEPLRRFARSRLRTGEFRGRSGGSLDALAAAFESRLTRLQFGDLPVLPNFVFVGADPDTPSIARAVATTSATFVADYLAVEPVWRDHSVILVSDGGCMLEREDAMEREARNLGKRWLISSFKAGTLTGAYWGVESARVRYRSAAPPAPRGYSKEFAKMALAAIPGDLAALSEEDAAMLENHGYLVADAAVQAHAPQLVPAAAPPLTVPHPDWLHEASESWE